MRPCFPPDFEFSETAGSMTLAITCRAPSKSVLLGSATPTVRSNVAPVAAEPRPLPPRGAGAAKHSGAAEVLVGPRRAWDRVQLVGDGAGAGGRGLD